MKVNKKELKHTAAAAIKSWQLSKKQAARIETIIRACINHLSYELVGTQTGNRMSIHLKKGDRIIVIERSSDVLRGPDICFSRDPYQFFRTAEHAYWTAERLFNKIKDNLAKEAAESNEPATVCAD